MTCSLTLSPFHPVTLSVLSQELPVRLLVVSDDERLADADGRGPQVAGRADHLTEQRLIVGPVAGEVVGEDVLAADDGDEFLHAVEELECLGGADLLLVGVDGLGDLERVGVKEPLRLLAGRSGPAVVAPVDALGHGSSPLACRRYSEMRAIL